MPSMVWEAAPVRLNDSRILAAAQSSVITEACGSRAALCTRSTPHTAHGVALYVALEGELAVESAGPVARGRVVLVAPDLAHAAHAVGPAINVLYDPEVAWPLAAFARAQGRPVALTGRVAERLQAALVSQRAALHRPDVLAGLAHEAAGWLAPDGVRRSLDRRVARVLDVLRGGGELGSEVRISRAHLAALFARDVGISMRRYQLWRRLLVGLAACAEHDATGAAHAAGFADLAHFTRTTRRLLGVTPSKLREDLLD